MPTQLPKDKIVNELKLIAKLLRHTNTEVVYYGGFNEAYREYSKQLKVASKIIKNVELNIKNDAFKISKNKAYDSIEKKIKICS